MPATEDGKHKLENDCLHIWPRHEYMLIALPNLDGSFTCTFFYPLEKFEELKSPEEVLNFFNVHFPDVPALIPNLVDDFFHNPTGHLLTVKCFPWSEGNCLLMGDAAHAMVPFFGQGLNCAMQDVTVLFDTIEELGIDSGWKKIFDKYQTTRKPDSDDIADMAVENYFEMRSKVADDMYVFRKKIMTLLGNRFPERFATRYEMVTFSTMPYSEARRRGAISEEITTILTEGKSVTDDPETIDLELAERLIHEKLSPLNFLV